MANRNIKNILAKGIILKSPRMFYKIEDVLGTGGFGITYKVSADFKVGNIPVHAHFAIKEHYLAECCEREAGTAINVSKAQQATYDESLADFRSEAKRLYQISGKNQGIVNVNEVFEANNTAYYVMELLNGNTIRQEVKAKGPYRETDALTIIRKVADAVAFLHSERITHLDIKPDNIIMHRFAGMENTQPVLIDFGLAKHYDKAGHVTSTLRTQGCSDGYSPIEQYVRIDRFSPTADVYALGATLFFMLTGKDPVIATEINRDHIDRYLLGTISNNTREAILNAMKKDKGERTASVLQFISDLNSPIAHDVSEDTNKTKISKKRHTTRFSLSETAKHINRKWITALAALTVLGIIIFWSWGRGDQAGSIDSPHGIDTAVIPQKPDVDIVGKTPKEIRNLGYDYQNGTGGKTKDYTKAMKYYLIAAEQGNTDAMVDIGYMYEMGYGVTEDYDEAVKWYQKASEQGNVDAKKRLEKLNNYLAKKRAEAEKKAAEEAEKKKLLLPTILFSLGKATIDQNQFANIEKIAKYLKEKPTAKVEIVGNVWPEGDMEKNMALAEARANAVKSALIKIHKIDENRLIIKGQSEKIYEDYKQNSIVMIYEITFSL